jgi:glucokinase
MSTTNTSAILCVDIGGTSTKAGVLCEATTLEFVQSIPSAPPVDSYAHGLVKMMEDICHAAQQQGYGLRQAGIAVAGFLDRQREFIVYNPNLAWLESYPLKRQLQAHFEQLEFELEIDSNAATMAEYRFGSGQGSRRFLCVTSGTGLGVGMTVEGVPLRFAYGCMGDIGHTIVLRDGPLCTCGGKGCAEIMVSAPAVAARYRTAAGLVEEVTLRDVILEAQSGNAKAASVLRDAGEWLGVAIASMANTFFPDHIAIAGGLSAAGDFVLDPAQRVFRETACVLARENVTFARAELGPMATLIGAAWPFFAEGVV